MDTLYLLNAREALALIRHHLDHLTRVERLHFLLREEIIEHMLGHAISDCVHIITGRYICSVTYYHDACSGAYDHIKEHLIEAIRNDLTAHHVSLDGVTRVKYLITDMAIVLAIRR